ncbi:MAG: hypothetical protein IMZ61_06390 [Planctomycetes bacterium]|nr:hypothetical protein [Thermoplasmata archaeon]MBE3143535.1 hypothetical protein [Planctomycetota bacterium]
MGIAKPKTAQELLDEENKQLDWGSPNRAPIRTNQNQDAMRQYYGWPNWSGSGGLPNNVLRQNDTPFMESGNPFMNWNSYLSNTPANQMTNAEGQAWMTAFYSPFGGLGWDVGTTPGTIPSTISSYGVSPTRYNESSRQAFNQYMNPSPILKESLAYINAIKAKEGANPNSNVPLVSDFYTALQQMQMASMTGERNLAGYGSWAGASGNPYAGWTEGAIQSDIANSIAASQSAAAATSSSNPTGIGGSGGGGSFSGGGGAASLPKQYLPMNYTFQSGIPNYFRGEAWNPSLIPGQVSMDIGKANEYAALFGPTTTSETGGGAIDYGATGQDVSQGYARPWYEQIFPTETVSFGPGEQGQYTQSQAWTQAGERIPAPEGQDSQYAKLSEKRDTMYKPVATDWAQEYNPQGWELVNKLPVPMSAQYLKRQNAAMISSPSEYILPQVANYLESVYGINWNDYLQALKSTQPQARAGARYRSEKQ